LFDQNWYLSDFKRAYILLACAFLYWLRHIVTLFYLLVRKVEWSEVFELLTFIAFFEVGLLAVAGGAFRNYSIELGWLDISSFIIAFLEIGNLVTSLQAP